MKDPNIAHLNSAAQTHIIDAYNSFREAAESLDRARRALEAYESSLKRRSFFERVWEAVVYNTQGKRI